MMMNFKKNQNNAVCSMDCKNCPNGASQPNPMDDPKFEKSIAMLHNWLMLEAIREDHPKERIVMVILPGAGGELLTEAGSRDIFEDVYDEMEADLVADEVAIILNESGKINGLPLNRAIYTEDGDMQDIYAGDFLVVGLTEDDFGSLTSEQMQKFEEQFHQPQMFVRMGRSIMAIPVPDDMVKKMEEKAAKPQEKSKPAPDRDSL